MRQHEGSQRTPDLLIAAEDVRYYHFYAVGSTIAMTNGSGAVTDRYDSGAWGEEYPILQGTQENPYRYVGQLPYRTHYQDPNVSDLLQLGVRFYEPEVGWFGQRTART